MNDLMVIIYLNSGSILRGINRNSSVEIGYIQNIGSSGNKFITFAVRNEKNGQTTNENKERVKKLFLPYVRKCELRHSIFFANSAGV